MNKITENKAIYASVEEITPNVLGIFLKDKNLNILDYYYYNLPNRIKTITLLDNNKNKLKTGIIKQTFTSVIAIILLIINTIILMFFLSQLAISLKITLILLSLILYPLNTFIFLNGIVCSKTLINFQNTLKNNELAKEDRTKLFEILKSNKQKEPNIYKDKIVSIDDLYKVACINKEPSLHSNEKCKILTLKK